MGHGLDKAPEFVVVKNRGKSSQFAAWHKKITANYYLALNDSDAQASYSGYFPSGGMTATTIKLGTDDDVSGQSNGPGIIYAWHSVEGFSKFGSYKGNANNPNNAFVYLGFRPALVICKKYSGTSSWSMWDNKRNPHNAVLSPLLADTTAVEATEGAGYGLSFLSNGFKVHTTSSYAGENSDYIYMAWAEMPFKYANAR